MTHSSLLCAKAESKVCQRHKTPESHFMEERKHRHLVYHNTMGSRMLYTQSECCFVPPVNEADSTGSGVVFGWESAHCLRLSMVEVSFWPRLTTAIQCHLTKHGQKHKSCVVIKGSKRSKKVFIDNFINQSTVSHRPSEIILIC